MKLQTTYCQEYFAINPKLAELLSQVEEVLKREFHLECAGWQDVSNNWLGNPQKICWHLKVTGTEEKVGELVHYIDYAPNNEIGFSFKSWLNDDGDEFIGYGDRIHDRLYSMFNVVEKDDDIMELVRSLDD